MKRLLNALKRLPYLKEKASVRNLILKLPASWTPNRITIARGLFVIPIWLCLNAELWWLGIILFAVASLLDGLDGMVAKARGMESELGAFLDPLVDKILVCGTWLALAPKMTLLAMFPVVMCIIMAVGITGLRVFKMLRGADRAGSVAAKTAGKFKFWAEILSLSCALLGMALGIPSLATAGIGILCLSVFLAVLSFLSQLQR